MSKPGYLSVNVSPTRRINLDNARDELGLGPEATDIDVLDHCLAWLTITAPALRCDALKERRVRAAIVKEMDSDRIYNEHEPMIVRARELEAITRRMRGGAH